MRLQGQNPDAGKDDGDLMSVAKDWAGELISGQTGTGRILVRHKSTKNRLRGNFLSLQPPFYTSQVCLT